MRTQTTTDQHHPTSRQAVRWGRRALRTRISVLERAIGAEMLRGDLERAGQIVSLRRDLLQRLAALRRR